MNTNSHSEIPKDGICHEHLIMGCTLNHKPAPQDIQSEVEPRTAETPPTLIDASALLEASKLLARQAELLLDMTERAVGDAKDVEAKAVTGEQLTERKLANPSPLTDTLDEILRILTIDLIDVAGFGNIERNRMLDKARAAIELYVSKREAEARIDENRRWRYVSTSAVPVIRFDDFDDRIKELQTIKEKGKP